MAVQIVYKFYPIVGKFYPIVGKSRFSSASSEMLWFYDLENQPTHWRPETYFAGHRDRAVSDPWN